mgnify:CR=1 FL=1
MILSKCTSNKRNTKTSEGFSIIEILVAISIASAIFLPILLLVHSYSLHGIVHSFYNPKIFFHRAVLDGKIMSSTRSLGIRSADLDLDSVDTGNCGLYSKKVSVQSMSLVSKEDIGVSTSSVMTGILSMGEFMYTSFNSASATDADIVVFSLDLKNKIDSYDIGPGVSRIYSTGRFIVAINSGVTYQYIVFVQDGVTGKLKEVRRGVFPYKSSGSVPITRLGIMRYPYIIMGTEKSIYPEIYMYDIRDGALIHTIETGYGINDMSLVGNSLIVYGPSNPEIDIFDISVGKIPTKIHSIDLYGGSGNAKVGRMFGDTMIVGRTKGNNELRIFGLNVDTLKRIVFDSTGSVSSTSLEFFDVGTFEIGWSVDSIQVVDSTLFVFSGDEWNELQVFNIDDKLQKISMFDLPSRVQYSMCYKGALFGLFVKESEHALVKITLK